MALLTAEGSKPYSLRTLIHNFEYRRYSHLANPSVENLFEVFDIFRRKKTKHGSIDEEGNIIEISQIRLKHYFTNGPHYETKGVKIAIRQKLPENRVGGEKYLSIIMSRDEKQEIHISTCVVVPTTNELDREQFGNYMRIGDLRTDYIYKKNGLQTGDVDGNDDGFGIPTGEWFLDGQSFDNAVTRAYLY